MDPVSNPFAPGAGSRPPQLAGRDAIIENATIAMKRVRIGNHAKSQMLLGLRGVGKTVLLNHLSEIAENQGYLTSLIEAPEGRRLADLLTPPLRTMLFRLSGSEKARVLANRALGALRSFAGVFKVSYGDFGVGIEAEPGTSATGDLEADLSSLLVMVAQAAREADQPVAIFIDEVQYLEKKDLEALIASLHRIAQKSLPLIVFGAGLPQLAGQLGDAKSYAERLFDFPPIGPLTPEASRDAIRFPIEDAGAAIEDDALDRIVNHTKGYPYFLQEWGHRSWDVAEHSPITKRDVDKATELATVALDDSFFRVRFDRLTPREQDYLRAMAEMGPGPHGSGDVAAVLNLDVQQAGPLRTGLIRKGMIYSPEHGMTAFTVPMFDEFMRREIPEWEPGKPAPRKRLR
ncbi:MAG: AAA family ATPase [bacterium]|nr:AAA family ATPase [Candidatus Kapabacteria bacterium]